MEFSPIKKRQRIYETIIQEIKDSIANERILPGEKLPSERSLASMFNVSRTSVKEAVTVLESSGIITVKPGVGMFINEASQQDLLYKFSQILGEATNDFFDLLELRQAIEGDAAFHAASRMTDDQRKELTALYHELVDVEKKGDIALEEDFAFHYFIVQSTSNHIMVEVINLVSDQMRANLKESRKHSTKDARLNNSVMNEHENIFQAIMQKKPKAARKAMWEHHQHIKDRYKARSLAKEEEEV